MAEATVWPILPDFVLIPLAAGNRRRFPATLGAAIAGMALGGAALYLFAYVAPERALLVLQQLPTVKPAKAVAARTFLQAHGVGAFLVQPWSGIPFKIWAIEAGSQQINPLAAIPIFIAGRSIRMALLTTISRLLAARFHRELRDFFLYIAATYLVMFFVGWYLLLQ